MPQSLVPWTKGTLQLHLQLPCQKNSTSTVNIWWKDRTEFTKI